VYPAVALKVFSQLLHPLAQALSPKPKHLYISIFLFSEQKYVFQTLLLEIQQKVFKNQKKRLNIYF